MKQHGRKDNNHDEIVDALRRVGASVQSLASVGDGCPDVLVAFRGWHVLEIKDGSKPPSARKLTDAEEAWHLVFGEKATVHIVCTVDEALQAIGATQ